MDETKLNENGQILWVAHAVRCIREAVAATSYARTGCFVYKKSHVLQFIDEFCPEHAGVVKELYGWKTDEETRRRMVEEFRRDREPLYRRFKEAMPQLSTAVEGIMAL